MASGLDLTLINGNDVQIQPIDWIWEGWLAKKKLHILGGEPGLGKTSLLIKIASIISVGGTFPDGSKAKKGNIIIWSGEDDIADGLAPRIEACGGDRSKFFFPGKVTRGNQSREFDPSTDIPLILEKIDELGGDVGLIGIDSVISVSKGDSHKNAEVRRDLKVLVDVAKAANAAMVGIMHVSKDLTGSKSSPSSNVIQRLNGSVAFGALARIVLLALPYRGEDGSNKSTNVLVRGKSNIGKDGGGYLFETHGSPLHDYPGVVANDILWGDFLDMGANDIAGQSRYTANINHKSAYEKASDFIDETLDLGPVPANEVYTRAEREGHSKPTLNRAKRDKGVVSKKVKSPNGSIHSVWLFPNENVNIPTENQSVELRHDQDLQGDQISL